MLPLLVGIHMQFNECLILVFSRFFISSLIFNGVAPLENCSLLFYGLAISVRLYLCPQCHCCVGCLNKDVLSIISFVIIILFLCIQFIFIEPTREMILDSHLIKH